MSFGYSAGDIYLCAQLVGSIIESFRKGPLAATSQYSNFEAEFRLIAKQLDELPEKSSSFVDLWGKVEAQCADFVVKYSTLVPTKIKAGNKEAKWRWIHEQGLMAFAKVQWPFRARDEAMALERNMLHLVQIAVFDMNTRQYKAQEWNHERYESLLQHVLQQYEENSKWSDEQIGNVKAGVDEIKDVLLPGESTKLFNRIEDIMRPRKLPRVSGQPTESYGLDIERPFDLLNLNVRPSEFTFEEAYEELGWIVTIMKNHVTRQQGLRRLPNASSIVALLEHISQTIKVALFRIGSPLPDDVGGSSHYTSDQKQLEAILNLIYLDWVRFIELAKHKCKRSRSLPIPSASTGIYYGQQSSQLGDIIGGDQWDVSRHGQPVARANTISSEVSRRDSREFSPRTKESLHSGFGRFVPSSVANSTVDKPVKMDISHADGSQDETGEMLKHCTISEIKFETEHDTAVVKIRSLDGKIKLHQEFGRNTKPSVNRSRKRTLSYHNSYQNFRTLDDTQTPHPSGAPIYIFKSKEDSHAFQTEVLQRIIPGWEVIYSAETQLIQHTETGNDCHLQILRVIQEDRFRCKSILYWETRCPELTGATGDFVQWSQSDFDSVTERKKLHTILHFADPSRRRKSAESKSSRLSSISLWRSSKDLVQSPPQSPSVVPPQTPPVVPPQLPPVSFTPSSFGNSSDGEDLKSLRSSGRPSFISASELSVSSIALPPSAIEAEARAEAKAKAKKEMGGLKIKFYSQKGGASLSQALSPETLSESGFADCLDRDDFLESFGWTPPSPAITSQTPPNR